MKIESIKLEDDLNRIVTKINNATWDDANEMCEYTESALKAYLIREDNIFLACFESDLEDADLLGIASARIQIKPYGRELWLYVDEVDVCADKRRKGVGKFIMQKLIELSEEKGCEELWLGAEIDNHPANKLYRSLAPDTISQVLGYAYETDS